MYQYLYYIYLDKTLFNQEINGNNNYFLATTIIIGQNHEQFFANQTKGGFINLGKKSNITSLIL